MKFQPGESGNPAGRPPGARNKKTIAMEEMFAATAQETAKFIIARAQCGDATAMRICMERTPPAFELPPVRCAADAQKAFDQVIDAFGRGAITMRAFPAMIAAVERMTRTAERIQALREGEDERYANQRVHGVHPSLIPKPTGEPDRYEALAAAIERGEDPFPDDPVKSAYVLAGEDLYSPVNSHPAPAAQETPAAPAAEDTPAAVEPGAPPDDALYFPVNCGSAPETEPGQAARNDYGPKGAPDQSEGEALYFPVNSNGSTAKAAPCSASRTLLLSAGPALDPRSYVTDQTWLASLKETGLPGATKAA